jgi:hypothetical protein
MPCEEAPQHLVISIQDGLVDGDMRLGPAVVVEVAPFRRTADDWPTLMVGALVVSPEMPEGIPAVWATDVAGARILAVDHGAREVSHWDSETRYGYPEAEEARRCLPDRE